MQYLSETSLQRVLQKYHFHDYFSSLQYSFRLVVLEKGELLSTLIHQQYMLFVLRGSYHIYSILSDGTTVDMIRQTDTFTCLGDLEFSGITNPEHVTEVTGECLCVLLDLSTCRAQLEEDARFLRFLLRSISVKMDKITRSTMEYPALEDRICQYLKENGGIQGVGKTASLLHCSRRQLQRYLQKFLQEGKIHKTGKGKYRISNENSIPSIVFSNISAKVK